MGRSVCNRRAFCSQTLATGRRRTQAARRPGADGPATTMGPYIDVHTHVGRTWNGHPGLCGRRSREVDGRASRRQSRGSAAGLTRIVELPEPDRASTRGGEASTRSV